MITAIQVKNRIEEILNTYVDKEDKEVKRLRKEKEFLDRVLLYLLTKPSLEFMIKERDRIQNRLDLINSGFSDYVKQNTNKGTDNPTVLKTLRDAYHKEFDVTALNRQIKTLRFILNNQ